MSDFILPDDIQSKREQLFAMPIYPIAEAIYTMQKKGENLDDFVIVVPTESDTGYAKFYIVHKDSIK